jgi:hypothetical protein
MTGANIPRLHSTQSGFFIEAINTLKFVEPWDIDDFRAVLEHLKVDGYYLFQGEIIKPSLGKRRQPSPEGRMLAALPPHCLWRVKSEFSTGR